MSFALRLRSVVRRLAPRRARVECNVKWSAVRPHVLLIVWTKGGDLLRKITLSLRVEMP